MRHVTKPAPLFSTYCIVYQKPLFSHSTLQRENGILKFIHFGDIFKKFLLAWQKHCFSMDRKPKQREKSLFSNKNLVVWTRPWSLY